MAGSLCSRGRLGAVAFSLAIEASVVERISGKDDADVHARWAVSVEQAYRAMAEESAVAQADTG